MGAVDFRACAAIEIAAIDAGFVTEMGGSSKGDGIVVSGATYNYSVGREIHYTGGGFLTGFSPMDRKNYFVFDLSGISAPIASASLELYAGTYESSDASETWVVVGTADHVGAIADITALALGNTAGVFADFDEATDPLVGMAKSLYGKLGDMPAPLSVGMVDSSVDDALLSFDFGPAGVGYLNSHLGETVILAGFVPTAMPPATPQSLFGFTAPDIDGELGLASPTPTPVLSVTLVPEPAIFSISIAIYGVLVVAGRRKCRGCGQSQR